VFSVSCWRCAASLGELARTLVEREPSWAHVEGFGEILHCCDCGNGYAGLCGPYSGIGQTCQTGKCSHAQAAGLPGGLKPLRDPIGAQHFTPSALPVETIGQESRRQSECIGYFLDGVEPRDMARFPLKVHDSAAIGNPRSLRDAVEAEAGCSAGLF